METQEIVYLTISALIQIGLLWLTCRPLNLLVTYNYNRFKTLMLILALLLSLACYMGVLLLHLAMSSNYLVAAGFAIAATIIGITLEIIEIIIKKY